MYWLNLTPFVKFWRVTPPPLVLSTCGKPFIQTKLYLKISSQNLPRKILFIRKSLNNLSPSAFNAWFSFSSDQYNYKTSSYTQGNFTKIFYKTNKYEKFSITVSAGELRNKIQKQLKSILLKDLSPNKTKTIVSNFYFKSY